jgi:general secretion pathway protein J
MKREAGFSLIEVLAAIAVFAIMSGISVSLLTQALRSKDLGEEAVERLAVAQRIEAMIRADIGQLVMRSVRSQNGITDPRVFAGDADGAGLISGAGYGEREILVLTRNGWSNPGFVQPRSTLQRVVWIYDGANLWRETYAYPDAVEATPVYRQLMAEGVSNLELAFLEGTRWYDEARVSETSEDGLVPPLAIRLRYQLEGMGQMEHIVLSPAGGLN